VDPPALGGRGEGWVVLQSIVIVAAVACAVIGPSWPNDSESWLRVIGFVLEAAGAGILIVSRITLGRSFTPVPRPRDRSTLRTTGIYAGARHPIYGGLLVLLLGLSFHRSPLVLAPTALLAGIFWLKSIREEAWLAERYPEYDVPASDTPAFHPVDRLAARATLRAGDAMGPSLHFLALKRKSADETFAVDAFAATFRATTRGRAAARLVH
jgi:protein-S-isoprenylcysteine O-methyltransferase Ste14